MSWLWWWTHPDDDSIKDARNIIHGIARHFYMSGAMVRLRCVSGFLSYTRMNPVRWCGDEAYRKRSTLAVLWFSLLLRPMISWWIWICLWWKVRNYPCRCLQARPNSYSIEQHKGLRSYDCARIWYQHAHTTLMWLKSFWRNRPCRIWREPCTCGTTTGTHDPLCIPLWRSCLH